MTCSKPEIVSHLSEQELRRRDGTGGQTTVNAILHCIWVAFLSLYWDTYLLFHFDLLVSLLPFARQNVLVPIICVCFFVYSSSSTHCSCIFQWQWIMNWKGRVRNKPLPKFGFCPAWSLNGFRKYRKMSGKVAGVPTENVYMRIFENNSFSGLLRSVGWFITDVSGLYIGRIFKGQVFKALP